MFSNCVLTALKTAPLATLIGGETGSLDWVGAEAGVQEGRTGLHSLNCVGVGVWPWSTKCDYNGLPH